MRADRLLAILLLLQNHGRLTARQLARQLDVSERTIYRDIDALGSAGVPVYADPGPQGGYSLLDSYRTTLTGLTDGELRSLFMLSVPRPLVDLGLQQEIKAALLKLSASLPEARRVDEERVRQRVYLDPSWEEPAGGGAPQVQTLYQAAWRDRCATVRYRLPGGIEISIQVEPYALVAKKGLWYLVFCRQGRFGVLPVSSLLGAVIETAGFSRQPDFALKDYWNTWWAEQASRRSKFPVRLRGGASIASLLERRFPGQVVELIIEEGTASLQATVTFDSLESARADLLALGRAVEVLEPISLRRSIQDYAEQILRVYNPPGGRP